MCSKYNKRNSTAGVGRAEANVAGVSAVIAQFLLQIRRPNKNMFDAENESQCDGAQHPIWYQSILAF